MTDSYPLHHGPKPNPTRTAGSCLVDHIVCIYFMKLEIEIPETVIAEAAKRAWQQAFKAPDYSHQSGGDGWEAVKSEVQRYVISVATNESIRDAVKQTADMLMPGIVRDCVTETLRKQAKRVVKEEVDGGTLFSANASDQGSAPCTNAATKKDLSNE